MQLLLTLSFQKLGVPPFYACIKIYSCRISILARRQDSKRYMCICMEAMQEVFIFRSETHGKRVKQAQSCGVKGVLFGAECHAECSACVVEISSPYYSARLMPTGRQCKRTPICQVMNYGQRISVICLYNSAVEMDMCTFKYRYEYIAITQVLAFESSSLGQDFGQDHKNIRKSMCGT